MGRSSVLLRSLVVPSALAACALVAGCSVTVKTQTKYRGSVVTAESVGTWAGPQQQIVVENANGDLTVRVGATQKVDVSMTPFAFADTQADGDAAIADAASTLAIDESAGKIYVHCSVARTSHGSAGNGTTGCEGMVVTVPGGTGYPIANLQVTGHNGSVTVNGISGTAIVHADNGPASLQIVNVVQGASIESSSGNGNATLTLPTAFATDQLLISVPSTGKLSSAFPDVTAATTSRGAAGSGAHSVVLKSDNGDLILNAD